MKLFYTTRILLLTALLVANLSTSAKAYFDQCDTDAADPSCCKNCGEGDIMNIYFRNCTTLGDPSTCDVTACAVQAPDCGYSDSFNDSCGEGFACGPIAP